MNTVRIATAALAATAGLVALAGPATADETTPVTAVEACIERHPGAVTHDAVTAGDDLVCVERSWTASAGDDTYLWVGADTDKTVVLDGGAEFADDEGTDTLSLADWSTPLVETYAENGYGGLFGVRVKRIDDPEVVRYTQHNDVVGDPNLCDRLSGGEVTLTLRLGAGSDTVNCVLGNIYTEGGDDTVNGATTGASVATGPGSDTVHGDSGTDAILLGSGADRAYVEGDGADTVKAGEGNDVVWASRNDTVGSATVR